MHGRGMTRIHVLLRTESADPVESSKYNVTKSPVYNVVLGGKIEERVFNARVRGQWPSSRQLIFTRPVTGLGRSI